MIKEGRTNSPRGLANWLQRLLLVLLCAASSGCFAPLRSPAIPANTLPEEFRMPLRTAGPPLNFSKLTTPPPRDYLLGPGDILEVTVPALFDQSEVRPLRVQVVSNGEVQLPQVGPVQVGGLNVQDAQRAINEAYADGFINSPRVSVILAEKSTVSVLVLGQVRQPGVHLLPKYENDVGHAVGAAQGLTDQAADYVEVHRRGDQRRSSGGDSLTRLPPVSDLHPPVASPHGPWSAAESPGDQDIFHIPLRGPRTESIRPEDAVLESGDVVVVPNRKHEVFYVVGRLSTTNTVRFTVGDRERELGVGFILPQDREIDVVTAVTMAGYIDPIDSPTTVTVHRIMPDGHPALIHVDLIKARYDRRETVLVQPGDIIYLNPDHHWWLRRTFDRVLGTLITSPYNGVFN